MKITALAIRKGMTTIALMITVTLLGIGAYIGLPRESSPDVKIPFVMVYAPYFGTSPADMENLVTRKLETQLKALPDLEEMVSTSSEGVSTIVLEFTPEVEMSDALQKVRDGVELAKPELPQDVKDDLIVYEISSDQWPIMQVVLSADYDPYVLKREGEDWQERLEQIRGVLSVDLLGGVEREVRVDIDPDRLRFYGLGLPDLRDAIALENITLPGGEIALGTYEYQVRVPGEFETVDIIRDIVINPAEDSPVYIGDVAEVSFGLKDRDSISRINGREAVTLSVKKRSGENIIRIADEVHVALEELTPTLPPGTEVHVIADQSVDIRAMVNELENNILSGLILVIAVLLLFLGFTNSLFVAMAIPFSMLASFVVIGALGLTLNMVVLFSLILALGMLVDNAIVIVENIYRHRSEGMEQSEAAYVGTHQVGGAVTASTVTTLCAFGPLVFWPGIMGEFMKYLPITVMITLAASLLVALVFNPVLCARFMRVKIANGAKKKFGDRLIDIGLRSYEPVLRWALHHRSLTLAGMLVVFVVVFMLFGAFNAGVELFPDVDPTFAYVRIEAPSGTRIEVSDDYARTVEKEIDELPDMKAFVTEVGSAGSNSMGMSEGAPPHLTQLSMEFLRSEDRKGSTRGYLEALREQLKAFTGAKLYVDKADMGPPTGKPINVEIIGEDFTTLGSLADGMKALIEDVPGIVDLEDDFDRGRPEIQVRPDLEKAARFGLRTFDVASTVQTAIKGEKVSTFRLGEDEFDIVLRYDQPSRANVEELEELTVFYEGESIPLTAFADVSYTTGLSNISRIDGQRVVTVSADVHTGYNGFAVLAQVQERLSDYNLPPGYRVAFTGENEDQEEAQSFLSRAFLIALMLILIVLITQFDSMSVPVVIMMSVIFSLIGVFLGLMITHTAFGIIMTGVGVISLAGIVVNNAIVLLDYVIQLRRSGMEKYEALIEAGRTRFRPVILTAITTILGLVPLTTGFSVDFNRLFHGDFSRALVLGGESSQWWGPMGVAVIWGLAVATFLTLIVVPVMYASIDPVVRALRFVLLGGWIRLFTRQQPAAAGLRRGGLVLLWGLAVGLGAPRALAETPGSDPGEKRAFEIVDYYRSASVGAPSLHPAGDRMVFTVGRYELEAGESWSELWMAGLDGATPHQLTHLRKHDGAPSFAPDGKHILFSSDRDGVSQLYLMPVHGGEAKPLTHSALGLSDPLWSPDGRTIAVTADVYPDCGADDECSAKRRDTRADGKLEVHVADELLYRHWTSWRDEQYSHVLLIDAKSGEILRDLTPGNWDAPTFSAGGGRGFAFSADGQWLCYVSNHDEDQAGSTNSDLWVVPTSRDGGPAINLTSGNGGWDGAPLYSPDGRWLAYISQETPGYESDLKRLMLYELADGGLRSLTDRERLDASVNDFRWAPDARSIYFVADGPGENPIYRVDLGSGKIREIHRDATIDGFEITPDGKSIVYNRRSIDRPLEIYSVRTNGKSYRRLTQFNQALEDEVDMRPPEEMWVQGAGDTPVQLYLIKPHGFDPTKRYPLILNVHGGPQGQWSNSYRGDWQVYPGKGYVVALPNPTGSTGFGQDLVDGIGCDWGGRVYDDLMRVSDALAELPYVDADRMGVMGWSYGGYMVMWMEGHTDRFRCSASMMGLYDLRSFYGGTEELWFPEKDLCGMPWNSPEYERWSPSNYVSEFRTPCLVITGEKDYRVPYTQSLQYFTALQRQGVPSRLIVYPEAGHWPSWYEMAFYYNAHLDWFAEWLGGEPAPYDVMDFAGNRVFAPDATHDSN